MGLSLLQFFGVLQKTHLFWIKVIQGRLFWYQSKTHYATSLAALVLSCPISEIGKAGHWLWDITTLTQKVDNSVYDEREYSWAIIYIVLLYQCSINIHVWHCMWVWHIGHTTAASVLVVSPPCR